MARKQTLIAASLAFISLLSFSQINSKSLIINNNKQTQTNKKDNSNKSILPPGCDPKISYEASKAIPPLIGNPKYIPTTSDADFFDKLKKRKYSVVFFAPGACRFSAAIRPIPGGNTHTKGWTLKQYRAYVYELQGDDVVIVETTDERETVHLLQTALTKARTTNR
tara:strand:- start:1380 stop:1877 length:498 start_codon:yes stop_codon:yes gene_type:complete